MESDNTDNTLILEAAAAVLRANPDAGSSSLTDALGLHRKEGRTMLEEAGLLTPDVEDPLARRWDRACDDADVAAARLCLEQGLDVNRPVVFKDRTGTQNVYPLMCACGIWDSAVAAELVKLLLDAGADPNAQDDDGDTALIYASDTPVIRMLLDAGADATLCSHTGESALHRPGRFDDAEAVRLLIRAGAPVNAEDSWGCTPLFCGMGGEMADECMALFLAAGADLEHRNHKGRTALESFMEKRQYHDAAVLLRHGAKPAPGTLSRFLRKELLDAPGKCAVLAALLAAAAS